MGSTSVRGEASLVKVSGLSRTVGSGVPLASAAVVALCAGVVGAGTRFGWLILAISFLVLVFFVLALRDWRRLCLLLVGYLPFAGLISLVMYPRTYLGDAVRDLLIVAPFYAAFFMRRGRSDVPAGVRLPLLLLVIVVVLQLGNPALPSL